MLLTPGAKPKNHHNSHLNSPDAPHSNLHAERRNKKADAEESSTRLKSHTSDIPTAKKVEKEAYAEGGEYYDRTSKLARYRWTDFINSSSRKK